MKKSDSTLLVVTIASGFLLMATRVMADTVLNDTFSSSTLNSGTPDGPTSSSTSYEAVTTAAGGLTAASIGAGHLGLSLGTTSGNGYEIQALFSSVALTTVGDYIQLAVTFTDAGGFLSAQGGTLCAGMYNSGGVGPLAGGLVGESSSGTSAATGGAAGWMGYTGQITTNHAIINLRPAQTGTGNNNQDVTFGGSISATKGYNNPFSSLGQDTYGRLTLTQNSTYTMVLTYELSADNTMIITNSLYSGSDMSGTLLSEYDATASGGNFLTSSFDSLAFGIYANKSQDTTLDINGISVITNVPEPSVLSLAGLGLLSLMIRLRRLGLTSVRQNADKGPESIL